MAYCPEPPLDPPYTFFEEYEEEINEAYIDLIWDECNPQENFDVIDEMLDDMHPDKESRRFFYIETLCSLLQEDEEREEGAKPKYPITPNYEVWRETRAKRYFKNEVDVKREMDAWPTTFGFVEYYWDEIVASPDEDNEENYYEVFEELFYPSLALYIDEHREDDIGNTYIEYAKHHEPNHLPRSWLTQAEDRVRDRHESI